LFINVCAATFAPLEKEQVRVGWRRKSYCVPAGGVLSDRWRRQGRERSGVRLVTS
jgi:hypothetical protein